MGNRFWKVWALAAGFMTASALVPSLFGQEAEAKTPPAATPKGRTIKLELAVTSGSGAKAYQIEVKPANATCHFAPQTIEVDPAAKKGTKQTVVTLKDVEIRGADRNVAVAFTIREADGSAKTIYRGYRVAADPKPGQVEQFTCWMSTPSRSASVVATPASDPTPTRR